MIRHVGGGYPRPMAAEVTWGPNRSRHRGWARGGHVAQRDGAAGQRLVGARVLDDWFCSRTAEFRCAGGGCGVGGRGPPGPGNTVPRPRPRSG